MGANPFKPKDATRQFIPLNHSRRLLCKFLGRTTGDKNGRDT